MSDKIISVIIPVFNNATTIGRLIKVLNQSKYKKLMEIICINDGSSDNSYTILEELRKDNDILKVCHQNNKGVSAARNKGLSIAEGVYISFIDADDTVKICEFDKVCGKVFYNEDDLAIFGIEDYFVYSDASSKVRQNYSIDKRFGEKEFFYEFGFLLNKHIFYSPCNKIYKKEIIDHNRLQFNEAYNFGEDMLFNLSYFRYIKNVAMYKDYVYNYFHDTVNTTSGSSKYNENEFTIFLLIVDKIKELLIDKGVFYENLVNFHKFIVRKLSASLNNVFAKNSPLSRIEKEGFLKQMYSSEIVLEALKDDKVIMDEFDQKILRQLHRHKMEKAIYWLYSFRNR